MCRQKGEIVQHIKRSFKIVFDTAIDSMVLMTLEGIILEVNEVVLQTKRKFAYRDCWSVSLGCLCLGKI